VGGDEAKNRGSPRAFALDPPCFSEKPVLKGFVTKIGFHPSLWKSFSWFVNERTI
jgi:hypothetical protein